MVGGKKRSFVTAAVALLITVLLLQDILSETAAASAAATARSSSKLARRNQRHRMAATKTRTHARVSPVPELEALALIYEMFEYAKKGHEVYVQIDHFRKEVGCRTPPAVAADKIPDAATLAAVYTELARKVYDECSMVQRINFLRAWGASAWNLLDAGKIQLSELPTISPSDCEPLVLTIVAMASMPSTNNCDEMLKSWVYYQTVCAHAPHFKPEWATCVNSAWSAYCQTSSSINGGAGGCDFDSMCADFFSEQNFMSRDVKCFEWRANINP